MQYTNSQMAAIIDEVIHSERNRRLLKRRYIDGVHIEPLAEEFELSVSQTKNILRAAKNKIESELKLS